MVVGEEEDGAREVREARSLGGWGQRGEAEGQTSEGEEKGRAVSHDLWVRYAKSGG